jgi:hypothetical protein
MSNTISEITRVGDTPTTPVHKWFKDYNLLVAVKLNPGANSSELARITGKDRPFISRRIKICAERGLIAAKYIINERRKRALQAELTPLGNGLLEVFGISLIGLTTDKLESINAEIELLGEQKQILEEMVGTPEPAVTTDQILGNAAGYIDEFLEAEKRERQKCRKQ